jgi:hypothetical protein
MACTAAFPMMVPAADLGELEANTWVTLIDPGNGHWGNPIVWSRTGGRLLHYTAYDVKVFNADKGIWTADYAWPGDQGFAVASIHHHHRGVGHQGSGVMTPSGVPCPALTIGGLTWDARRNELILVMHGLMAAYDPQSRKWRDMKPQTEVGGQKMPGPPGVYGPSICHDPLNDQLVMFPHWGGRNTDLRGVTGEVSGHHGTLVYSFAHNLWKRPEHPLGPPDVVRARNELVAVMGRLSGTLDELYVLRRRPSDRELAAAAGQLEAVADALGKLHLPGEARTDIGKAVASLITAREAAATGDAATAIRKGGHAFWLLRQVRQHNLRVEPPPRCGAPLVYHPEQEAMVMFGGQTGLLRTDLDEAEHYGGQPGSLNDTWIYDCRTRHWRQLECQRRPLPTLWPKLVYDPHSRNIVLVTVDSRWGGEQPEATLWTLDVATSEWSDCGTQPLPGPVGFDGWYGWGNQQFEVGYDPQQKMLLMVTAPGPRRNRSEVNYALRLDVHKLASKPAPEWEPPDPPQPHELPPDDPAWIARLQSLPPNTWIEANPKGRRVPRRDWGTAACDPVRGNVYYFGGGHSTYQGRDVAVYAVGANRWCYAAGGHNDHVPPVGWGGAGIDFWGAPNASHQRNSYLAIDGRMYVNLGTSNRRWAEAAGQRPGARYAWFYDMDRGGVWRELEIERVERTPLHSGFYGNPHLASADGKAMGFGGALHPYDGRFFAGEAYFSVLDIYENSLKLQRIPSPMPDPVLECRPFCYLPDRKAVFFFEAGSKREAPPRTWTYDFTTNRFTQLHAKNHPPGDPLTVLFFEGQDAVFALMKESGEDPPKPWIFCLKRNAWALLPTRSEDDVHFQRPYAQTVYSAKYGVLVNLPGTEIMRPDVSKVDW